MAWQLEHAAPMDEVSTAERIGLTFPFSCHRALLIWREARNAFHGDGRICLVANGVV
ncbi:MAG: hypothetical protein IPK63_09760 [Candidatus Competibacteraceae bacterium]|nr:hypothetical protein [Candidatus Competibacteraceae bacterium]